MYQNLEDYLEEIDNYLGVDNGSDEILSEIRSHILEKTEQEHGEFTEETIADIIAGYGTPKEVAEQYLEGFHIIAPAYRKYLFRYTGILFLCHYGLIALSFLFDFGFFVFPPFFSLPTVTSIWKLLHQIPTTLVFDFGLVAFGLFFLTQSKSSIKLPLPKCLTRHERKEEYKPEKPHIAILIVGIVGLGIVVGIFQAFGTLFFKALPLEKVEPLFSEPASTFYSLAIIIFFGLEMFFYTLRFFHNSFALELWKNLLLLSGLWFLMNYRVSGRLLMEELELLDWLDHEQIKTAVFMVIALVISIESLVVVYKMIRNRMIRTAKPAH